MKSVSQGLTCSILYAGLRQKCISGTDLFNSISAALRQKCISGTDLISCHCFVQYGSVAFTRPKCCLFLIVSAEHHHLHVRCEGQLPRESQRVRHQLCQVRIRVRQVLQVQYLCWTVEMAGMEMYMCRY